MREARARSIGLHGMSHYRIDAATHPPQLVMGFGHLTESAIDRGIATIALALLVASGAAPACSS